MTKHGVKVARGRRVVVAKLGTGKGPVGLEVDLHLPKGEVGVTVGFNRVGWGADQRGGRDSTGSGWHPAMPHPPASGTPVVHKHDLQKGGGPIEFTVIVPGRGSVVLPLVICKTLQ